MLVRIIYYILVKQSYPRKPYQEAVSLYIILSSFIIHVLHTFSNTRQDFNGYVKLLVTSQMHKVTCWMESAFALKEASRNSASFLSLFIFLRSEWAAFTRSFPELELDTSHSWSNASNLWTASSTLSNAYRFLAKVSSQSYILEVAK